MPKEMPTFDYWNLIDLPFFDPSMCKSFTFGLGFISAIYLASSSGRTESSENVRVGIQKCGERNNMLFLSVSHSTTGHKKSRLLYKIRARKQLNMLTNVYR